MLMYILLDVDVEQDEFQLDYAVPIRHQDHLGSAEKEADAEGYLPAREKDANEIFVH